MEPSDDGGFEDAEEISDMVLTTTKETTDEYVDTKDDSDDHFDKEYNSDYEDYMVCLPASLVSTGLLGGLVETGGGFAGHVGGEYKDYEDLPTTHSAISRGLGEEPELEWENT